MENYVLKSAKEGIMFLCDLSYENNNKIKNYVIDNENNLITIKYMNGNEIKKKLDEVDISQLHQQQIEEFKKLKEQLMKHSKYQLILTSSAFAIYTLASVLFYSTENYLEGSIYAVGSVTFFTFARKSYKLRKHINLVEWVCDNKEIIDEIIVEDHSDNKVSRYLHSEEIYKNGIDLNNVSNVPHRQLKKIKKKAEKYRG